MRKRKLLLGISIALAAIAIFVVLLVAIPPPSNAEIPKWVAGYKVVVSHKFDITATGGTGPVDGFTATEIRRIPIDAAQFPEKLKAEVATQAGWMPSTKEANSTSWHRQVGTDSQFFWSAEDRKSVVLYYQYTHRLTWLERLQQKLTGIFRGRGRSGGEGAM